MAWYTHQILADFLNRTENHDKIGKALDSILSDDIVLTYGTQTFCGKAAVIQFFEETSKAIASKSGFSAVPIIICDTEDPEHNITADNNYTAIALISKLEEYVSWFFLLRSNDEFLLNRIYGTQGIGYAYYRNMYSESDFDYSEYTD